MTRIEPIAREDMDDDQARVHDAAAEAGNPVGGPFTAYIRIPDLYQKAQDMRSALNNAPLSQRERQIVYLMVARHWNAHYPWYAQARNGLKIGLDREIIDAINARTAPALSDEREQTSYAVANELLGSQKLSDQSFAAARDVMGEESLVALVVATGQFMMTCCTAAAFAIAPPADEAVPLLDDD